MNKNLYMLFLKKIFSVRVLSFLLYLNGLLWYVFAIWLGLSARQNYFHGINLYSILVFLMFSNFLIFLILAYLVFRKHRWSFYLAISWLILNFFLTLTDEFGLLDMVVFFLNFVTIIYTIVLRERLAPRKNISEEIRKTFINK